MVKYPEDWKVVPLGDVAAITRGGSPRPIQAWLTDSSDGLNWIKIGDVSVGAKYITSTEERIIPLGARYSREVKSGDFILSNSMSFGRPYILKIDGCIHDGWLAIQEYSKSYDTEYLYYILSSEDVFSQYVAMAAGSSVKNLNKDKVSDVKIPLPPLPEQKRIAAVLGNVDKLIDNLSRQIEKKRLVKQGVMQDLLTGRKRLPGFTGEWENGTLRGKVNCLRGVSYSGLHDVFAEESDRTIRLLRSNNIQEARFVDYDVQFINRLCASEEQMLREDDIMVCMANGSKELVGKSCYFDKRLNALYTFGAFMACLRARTSEVCMSYVFQLLNSKSYWENIALALSGSSINNLRPGDILDMSFSWPTLAEQKAIAKVLGDMDVEIAKLEAKFEKYRQLKQGLMNDLLTGKVRI